MAAELAAQLISQKQLKILKEAFENSKQAVQHGLAKDIVKYNTIFHNAIVNASNNNSLIYVLEALSTRIVYYRNALHRNFHRKDDFLSEHQQILEAIEERNAPLARKCMEEHIETDIKVYLSFLESDGARKERTDD